MHNLQKEMATYFADQINDKKLKQGDKNTSTYRMQMKQSTKTGTWNERII